MLKEHSNSIKLFVALLDVLLMLVAFFIAYYWRFNQGALETPFTKYLILPYLSIPLTIVTFYFMKLYSQLRYWTGISIFFKTVISLVIAGIISASLLYLLHAGYLSRLFFAYYFILGSFFIVLEKIVWKLSQDYLRQKGYGVRNVLLVGAGAKLARVEKIIKNHSAWGLRIVTIINHSQGDVGDSMQSVLRNHVIDEVLIAFSRSAARNVDIGNIMAISEKFGKTIKVFINLHEELKYSKLDFCHFSGMPAMVFYSKTIDPDLLLLKRGLDILGAVVGLCITALMFPFIALAIKLNSPGPILFSQSRVGLNGRIINIYKFRSMSVDAEETKKELLEKNEVKGPIFKIKNDPRITRVGKFLRKTSLDEFPQFWNVLKGDLSLVGTRPPTPDEVQQYRAWHYRRISMRPGLTGLWQASGRNKIKDFDDIVALDLEYISSWSILLDFKILCKTVIVLFRSDEDEAM